MITEKQAEVGASWWANCLANPTFDNGDTTKQGGMATMLAHLGHQHPSNEVVMKFKEILKKKFLEDPKVETFGVGVDYHPEQILMDSLKEAGYTGGSINCLPWKTWMRFKTGGVQVKMGYGKDMQNLPM